MSFSMASVRAVERLLRDGEVSQSALAELSAGHKVGLWSYSKDNNRAVVTNALISILDMLGDRESVAAIFAFEPELRNAWLRIVAARLKEQGARRDAIGLCQAIDTLALASNAVLDAMPQASLTPTNYAELEMALFGATAEQAVVTPKLLRIMGATANLMEGGQALQTSPLPNVVQLSPEINWVRGRLLRLPTMTEGETDISTSAILSGGWHPLNADEIDVLVKQKAKGEELTEAEMLMGWVLARPWPFLLAQIVFTQEAWAAERISGGLALELEESHYNRFHHPPQVRVVVTLASGYEILCGSLGELLMRVLASLSVSIFAGRLTATQLDDRLSQVIQELLARKVWRFDYRSINRRAGYQIHEDFSDSCYRSLGSKHFYRQGSTVTGAIRSTCERWAEEQLARARRQSIDVRATA